MTTFRRWLFGIAERNWHARAGTRRRVVVGTGLDHAADPGEPTADYNPKVLKDSCESGERIAPRQEQLTGSQAFPQPGPRARTPLTKRSTPHSAAKPMKYQ